MTLVKKGNSGGNKIIIAIFTCLAGFIVFLMLLTNSHQKKEYEELLQRRAQIEQQEKAERQRLASLTPEEIAADKAAKDKAEQERQVQHEKMQKEARAANLMAAVDLSADLLTGAEIDLKHNRLSSMSMEGVGAMLEVIYSTASSIQAAWSDRDTLSEGEIAVLKSLEARLKSFQHKALPQMRLAFKKQVATTLWEHDVVVKLAGALNTKISLISYQFAANANIKVAYDQLIDLFFKLRFKQVEFVTDNYTHHGSGYNLATPADNVIATYNGEFQTLNRVKGQP